MNIDVDFDVFKELTARRMAESDTYNDVLRRLLGLTPTRVADSESKAGMGATFQGVFFPEGTQFRGTHKGRTYTAEIRGGEWVGADGVKRTSPSDAAVAVTGKNWNGWLLWHCKRPGDVSWHLINNLRSPGAKLAAL